MQLLQRVALCALLLAVTGCHAQQAQTNSPLSTDVQKKVQSEVRQVFNVPPDVNIAVGNPSASEFTGYVKLPITFSRVDRVTTVDFLLSNDQNTLVRMDKFDLTKVKTPKQIAEGLDIKGRPTRGNANAKVTIVNFDDFECPYCAMMHKTLFPDILNQYGSKVRIVYKDFPLVSIHPWAMHAALDANCLFDQSNDAYWDFADTVHGEQQQIQGTHDLKKANDEVDAIADGIVKKRALDATKYGACVQKGDKSGIEKSMAEGEALKIDSTPTLFINGERVEGALPADMLKQKIDAALKDAGESIPVSPLTAQPNTQTQKNQK